MKVLLSRLHEFLPSKPPAEEVAKALSQAGIEIAQMTYLGKGFEKVIVAQVKSFKKHPQADRLRLCEVFTGIDTLQIVCGASNFKEGDKVCLAQVDAHLPNDLKIKASNIRGESSAGMLCSEEELKLKDQSEGILILPTDAPIGMGLVEYFQLDDHLFTLEITPNRGDCLSVIGIVREIAAVLGCSHQLPFMVGDGSTGNISVHVEATEACYKFTLRHLTNIELSPSPLWLKNRIERMGARPINTIVDITHDVMFERGQPLHAFDAKKITGRVTVRFANEGETIVLLDGQEYKLEPQDLVVADERGPIGLAGIMGGAETAVSDQTTEVLLESAWFSPVVVRKTAKRLGLHTEASHRFERNVDIEGVWSASTRAATMLSELCGAKMLRESALNIRKIEPQKLMLKAATLKRVLGDDVKPAGELLSRLGFSVEKVESVWNVEVPPRRSDITREIDLVEEVARLYGYAQFKAELPNSVSQTFQDPHYTLKETMRSFLATEGLLETCNLSFTREEDLKLFQWNAELGSALKISNPIRSDLTHMRTSLLPNLLQTWKFNKDRQAATAGFFEIGHVFSRDAEKLYVAGLLAGEGMPKDVWAAARAWDVFDAKGILENLFALLRMGRQISFDDQALPGFLHPGQALRIAFRKKAIGYAGQLHPAIVRTLDCGPAVVFELCLNELTVGLSARKNYKPFSAFPHVERDFAFVVADHVPAEALIQSLGKIKNLPLIHAALFDVYKGQGVPETSKSIAFKVKLGALDRTLDEHEIQTASKKIIEEIQHHFNATLRA